MSSIKVFWGIVLLCFLSLGFVFGTGTAKADAVDVLVEGAYTDSDLVLYVYADINADPLISFGVKIGYDATKLDVVSAEKNESVWYMGNGTDNYPYKDPEIDTAGQVVIIGGKLDTNAPTAGVLGSRVLLGKVSFTRKDGGADPGSDTATYFGISVDQGHEGSYADFVTNAGADLDGTGVSYAVIIRERGDANGDGRITPRDINAVKVNIGVGDAPCYADCDGNGAVTPRDINCVKSKI